jgi:alkylation response protein AidB-like acyl-CoA dehydrogenase
VSLAAAVRAVGEQAALRAQEIEELRRLPDDLAAALVDSGLPRALVPKAYNGPEHDLLALVDAVEELAFHDGATAWCGMIAATTSGAAPHLPAEWAERIYGDPRSVTGGFAMPAAQGTRVDGGIVVSGRWQWGSFTHHCTWIGGGIVLDGQPLFVYFERGQVELLDTWRVAGLKGTGSTDYQVDNAFVPEGRWVVLGAPPLVDTAASRLPFFGRLAVAIAAVALGLARRAQHELVETATTKKPSGSGRTLAERPVIQAEVAKAEAAVRSAAAFLAESVEAATQADSVTDDHRRLMRLAATNATWQSARAVDLMYSAGGGSSIHEGHPLQRVFRDVHVVTQHGMVAERTYEPVGRMALGLPTDTSQL